MTARSWRARSTGESASPARSEVVERDGLLDVVPNCGRVEVAGTLDLDVLRRLAGAPQHRVSVLHLSAARERERDVLLRRADDRDDPLAPVGGNPVTDELGHGGGVAPHQLADLRNCLAVFGEDLAGHELVDRL